jgi:hypothetical protein
MLFVDLLFLLFSSDKKENHSLVCCFSFYLTYRWKAHSDYISDFAIFRSLNNDADNGFSMLTASTDKSIRLSHFDAKKKSFVDF